MKTQEETDLVAAMDEVEREEFEERAAIFEFDAGMTREEAEAAALKEVARRHWGVNA